MFYECVLGRIPDGRVLSHDMPEGVYASTLMATDIAFTDKTPKNAVSYYRRLHRWIRGDTQNLLFLKQGMGFSGVFKILSNFIGHISAVFAAAALAIFAFCTEVNPYSALLFVFLPQLLPAVFTLLRALGRLSVSRYRSFALQFSSLLLRTGKDLLYNLVAFAQTAFTSLDAICRAVWRMGSGRKLLEWVTASQEDGRAPNGLVRYIREFLPGALFGALLVFFAPAFAYKAAGALFFLFPVLAWVLARPRRTAEPLKGASRAAAVGYAPGKSGPSLPTPSENAAATCRLTISSFRRPKAAPTALHRPISGCICWPSARRTTSDSSATGSCRTRRPDGFRRRAAG